MNESVGAAASRFRRALETGGFVSIGLQDFPYGACGDTCLMLGQYLTDQGFGAWTYRTGRDPATGQTHAWLEQNGTLLDITADQFPDGQPPVVATTDPSWHDRFKPDGRPRTASLDFVGPAAAPLRSDYTAAAARADTDP